MIINNTNSLLRTYQGADGIKTGTTDAAGKCLIASATRNGRKLIAVSLKSHDRFGDCARLLDYGFKSSPTLIIDKEVPFKELRINNGNRSHINVYPAEDVYIWQVEGNPKVERKVEMQYYIEAPVLKGSKMGILNLYVNGKLYNSIDLTTREEVEKTSLLKRLRDLLNK